MSPYDRGTFEPGEEVRVFDSSDDEDDVEGSRLPLLIVLALLVLAMFGGVVWLAYTQGVARGRTETPVVTAANGPARVAPANAGGADQPYKGFKIYEQPAPPDDDVAANGAPAAKPAEAPPATVAKVEPPAPKPAPAPEAKPVVTAAPPAPKPVAPPAPKVAASVPAPAKPDAAPKPEPVKIGPATTAPRALAPAAAPQPAAASGAAVLQIGAYKSQADADTAWKAYHAKHAALLAGYGPDVQQADLGDKGTWYRLRITGIAGKDVASALCDRLKADGGACFLGK
jgi:outer membrane biosynthesis protein TonB